MRDPGTHDLSERDHAILTSLARARVLTGVQLERLHAAILPAGTPERTRRRILSRLVQLGYVTTLDRRIGGVRAGSAGLVYTLDTAGQRLTRPTPIRGRPRHPRPLGPMFLVHSLAVAELYVQLVEASRVHDFHLVAFVTEPHSWQPTGTGRFLRPDAYLVLATSKHRDC
jgi:Replication-relaxation